MDALGPGGGLSQQGADGSAPRDPPGLRPVIPPPSSGGVTAPTGRTAGGCPAPGRAELSRAVLGCAGQGVAQHQCPQHPKGRAVPTSGTFLRQCTAPRPEGQGTARPPSALLIFLFFFHFSLPFVLPLFYSLYFPLFPFASRVSSSAEPSNSRPKVVLLSQAPRG